MAESLLSNNSPAPEPVFPRFKPLALADREILRQILWDYQAETSELTFTNLFNMDRGHETQPRSYRRLPAR